MTEEIAQNATSEPRKEPDGTSTRGKSFKKRCLRCSKYFTHHHTPAEFNTPCKLCPCTYFYGWEQFRRKKGFSAEEWAARRKRPETVEEKH